MAGPLKHVLIAADENDLWFFDLAAGSWLSAKGKVLPIPPDSYPSQKALLRAAEDVALFNNLVVYEINRSAPLHDALHEITGRFRSQ